MGKPSRRQRHKKPPRPAQQRPPIPPPQPPTTGKGGSEGDSEPSGCLSLLKRFWMGLLAVLSFVSLIWGFYAMRPIVLVDVGEGVFQRPEVRRFTFRNEGELDAYDVRWKVFVPEIVRNGNNIQRHITHLQKNSIPLLRKGDPSTEFQRSEPAMFGPHSYIIRGEMRVQISYATLWGLWRINREQRFNARNDGQGGTEWLPSKKSQAP